jgi:hypothetical protein
MNGHFFFILLKLGEYTSPHPPYSNLTVLPVYIYQLFDPTHHNGTVSCFQTSPSNLCQQLIIFSFARFRVMPKYGSIYIQRSKWEVHNFVWLTSLVAEVTSNKRMVIEVAIYIVPDFYIEQGQMLDAHKNDTHFCILGIIFPSNHVQLFKGDSFTTETIISGACRTHHLSCFQCTNTHWSFYFHPKKVSRLTSEFCLGKRHGLESKAPTSWGRGHPWSTFGPRDIFCNLLDIQSTLVGNATQQYTSPYNEIMLLEYQANIAFCSIWS